MGWWIALVVLLVIVGNLALLWPKSGGKQPPHDDSDS